jgi:hypothetical protein
LRFIREKQEAEIAGEKFQFESVEYKKDTFQIKFRLIQFTIVSEASIQKYKIDFMQWLQDQENPKKEQVDKQQDQVGTRSILS